MKNTLEEALSLKEMICAVRKELAESQEERESRGEDALFEVENLILEINFVVTKDVKGGFKFKVLSLGGLELGGGVAEQQVHKITLSLNAIKDGPGRHPRGMHPALS